MIPGPWNQLFEAILRFCYERAKEGMILDDTGTTQCSFSQRISFC